MSNARGIKPEMYAGFDSPGITSNSFRDNSLKLNDLSTSALHQPKSVCTTVCTKSASAAANHWQPSSAIGRIHAAWPHLPPHIRDTILTLVDSIDLTQERHLFKDQPSVQLPINNRDNLQGISKDILRRTILKAVASPICRIVFRPRPAGIELSMVALGESSSC